MDKFESKCPFLLIPGITVVTNELANTNWRASSASGKE